MTSPLDPKRIFRESALKRHMEGESVDELLVLPPKKSYFTYLYLGFLGIILLGYLFFGALTIEVKGKGIFLGDGGVSTIEAQTSGFISKLLVHPGDFVKKGDLVAELYNTKQEVTLKFVKIQLEGLQASYDKLKTEYSAEDEKIREGYHLQIAANQEKIKQFEEDIPSLESTFERRKKLANEGLISTALVLEAQKLLAQRRTALEATKSTVASIEAKLKKSYRAEELQALQNRLLSLKEERDLLELNMKNSQVFSPFDARVLDILVRLGDVVTPGKKLMWLEAMTSEKSENLVLYALVYNEIGKSIPVGLQILIEPSIINAAEFGSLIGEVVDVSPFSVANEQLETYIHSKGLVTFLTEGAPNPYLVKVRLIPDPSTPSGYKWTSGKGMPFKLTSGTVATVSGIAFYERPIVRLLPYWKLEQFFDSIGKWIEESL